jgi:hypothetical protein
MIFWDFIPQTGGELTWTWMSPSRRGDDRRFRLGRVNDIDSETSSAISQSHRYWVDWSRIRIACAGDRQGTQSSANGDPLELLLSQYDINSHPVSNDDGFKHGQGETTAPSDGSLCESRQKADLTSADAKLGTCSGKLEC